MKAVAKNKLSILLALFLVALPSLAHANAGTPLMWTTSFHLFFGNALIGLFEGLLLIRIYKIKSGGSIGFLILANYVSAFLCFGLLQTDMIRGIEMNLYNAWPILWIGVVVTYFFTLLIEFPFAALALRKERNWKRKAVGGTLIIQSSSYMLLFGIYWLVSFTSLYTKTELVEPTDIQLPSDVTLYYISDADNNVYERSFATQEEGLFFELESETLADRLFVRESEDESGKWEIVALMRPIEREEPKRILVKGAIEGEAEPSWWGAYSRGRVDWDTHMHFGPVAELGPAKSSPWGYRTGYWAAEGILVGNEGREIPTRLSFETPFGSWRIRNATHLPDDVVLFQLGSDQICVYDPEVNELAMLVRGRGPVAVIEREVPSQKPTADK